MSIQSIHFLLLVQLLIISYVHVHTAYVPSRTFQSNVTDANESILDAQLPRCLIDKDCAPHSYCNDGDCFCDKGWITWRHYRHCTYKQSSKIMAFVVSFITGIIGLDWFILSRRDSLYILCGILKLLLSAGCCIWNPLAARSKSRTATTAASCLSVTLTLIAFVWWFVDWIRILFNSFPDGNGAPLV